VSTREKAPTILTEVGARRMVARVRDALALADDLLVELYDGRAWEALGHASWAAMCEAELPELRMLRLSKVAQTEKFTECAKRGLSTRATADAYGVSQGTVRNRLKGVELPETVVSLDGRRRPSRAAQRPETVARPEVFTYIQAAQAIAKCGRGTTLEVMDALRWRQGPASVALSKAARKGLVVPTGERWHVEGASPGFAVYVAAAR